MPRKTKDIEENEVKSNNNKTTKKAASTKTKKSENIKLDSKTEKQQKKKASVSSKKNTTTNKVSKKENIKPISVEYYDLPYRYNKTVVKLLAQTPNTLFIYWDISDEDIKNYKKTYGDNFFEQTKPVLIIHNKTLNYTFEIDINDFANSWYLKVNDSKCDYKIELGRRPIVFNKEINTKINDNYVYISSSNNIESPNDKVLFNINPQSISFKNIKTKEINYKNLSNISFIPQLNKMLNINNIYSLYKNLYSKDDLTSVFNPSSGNPSSNSFISSF